MNKASVLALKGAQAPFSGKIIKSKKLFYSKFLYKISIKSTVSRRFGCSKAAANLIGSLLQIANDTNITSIRFAYGAGYISWSVADLAAWGEVIAILSKYQTGSFRIRSECVHSNIFTNDYAIVDEILAKLPNICIHIERPANDKAKSILTAGREIEFCKNANYEYKAYLKNVDYHTWIDVQKFINEMPHLVKPKGTGFSPPYILLKSEKSITLFELRFSNIIRKVTKLVESSSVE